MSAVFNAALPVSIGSDHAGFDYKTILSAWLKDAGWLVDDKGVDGNHSVDYPDYAHPVAEAVEQGKAAFGILICGSGNGVCMTANKHQDIRAGLCWNTDVAKLIRQHNNANIICIPARFVAVEYARQMIELFISTPFEGGRHQNRINKMSCA